MPYSTATGYSYKQRGDVVLTQRTGTRRNHPSNYKPYVLLKGIDTTITFFIKAEGDCALPLHNININAKIIKKGSNSLSLNKNLRIVNYEGGVASLTVSSGEVQNMDAGYYILVLTYTDENNQVSVLWADQNRRSEFAVEVVNNILPAAEESPTLALDDFSPVGTGGGGTNSNTGTSLPVVNLGAGQYGVGTSGTYGIIDAGGGAYYAISVFTNDGGNNYYVTDGAQIFRLGSLFDGLVFAGLPNLGNVQYFGTIPVILSLSPNVYTLQGGQYGIPITGEYAIIPNSNGEYFWLPVTSTPGTNPGDPVTYVIDNTSNPTHLTQNFNTNTYNNLGQPAGQTSYVGEVPATQSTPYDVYNLLGGTYGVPIGAGGAYGIRDNGDGTYSRIPVSTNDGGQTYYPTPGNRPEPLTGFTAADLGLLPQLGTVNVVEIISGPGSTGYGTNTGGTGTTAGSNPLMSSWIPGTAQTPNPNGLNTLAIYARGATGTFKAQATLAVNPTTDADWFDIKLSTGGTQINFANHTGVEAFVFDGMFYWMRFIKDISSGSIDKVIYRA